MIEIQLKLDGKWIPLVRAMTSMDLGIGEAQRILNSGIWGIRIGYPDGEGWGFRAWRYTEHGPQFAWQSGSMAAPAFARLDGRD